MRPSWLRILLLAGALGFLITLVQLNILAVAFEKLGLSHHAAYLLLASTLAGSLINLPLFRITPLHFEHDRRLEPPRTPFGIARAPFTGTTLAAVNAGGCLVPVCFSIYLLMHFSLNPAQTLIAVAAVAWIAYASSRPIAGVGVAMPIFFAPAAAALFATALDYEQRAPLAYISGTLGVLLGADIFRLRDIRALRAPMASIGGAGSFDGIFISGLFAVLLT